MGRTWQCGVGKLSGVGTLGSWEWGVTDPRGGLGRRGREMKHAESNGSQSSFAVGKASQRVGNGLGR